MPVTDEITNLIKPLSYDNLIDNAKYLTFPQTAYLLDESIGYNLCGSVLVDAPSEQFI